MSSLPPLRIATRQSALALWQAHYVADALRQLHPGLTVELVPMVTKGDRILDVPLAKIGGKGLFVKELEHAMLDGRADIAVHSMKDVPMAFPEGLELAVVCERADPSDAFVSSRFESLGVLPQGAIVGTSSLRRQCQLRRWRPDLQIRDLRGNVNTRLARLDAGEFDAIVLATAGLMRLDMADRIRHRIAPELMLPAVGQGAVGIECRSDDEHTKALLAPLSHHVTERCVAAERAMNIRLQGGCQVPIAGFATYQDGQIQLRARVGAVNGSRMLEESMSGAEADAEAIGTAVAERLLAAGADVILAAVYGEDRQAE